MIFAREVSDSLTSLVKKLDTITAATGASKTASFVIFLSDDEDLEKKLKDLAKKEGLKECTLAIDSPAGPGGYNIAKDADVTAIIYKGQKVQQNFAFKKGELKSADVDKIVSAYKDILK